MMCKTNHHVKSIELLSIFVPDEPMLPFPKIISLQQKCTPNILHVHHIKSLQKFLLHLEECFDYFNKELVGIPTPLSLSLKFQPTYQNNIRGS